MKNLIILLGVFILGFSCAHLNEAKKAQFQYPEVDLQEQYKDYNEEYFGNKLPKDVKVSFEAIPIDSSEGVIEGESWCNADGVGCYIKLNRRYADASSIYLEVLLHEMVHLSLMNKPEPYTGHGKPFQDKMKQLALSDAFYSLW